MSGFPATISPLKSAGSIAQRIDDATTAADLLRIYGGFDEISPGDFVTVKASSNGQMITSLSINPLIEDAESTITIESAGIQPLALEVEASISHRLRHSFSTLCVFEDGPDGPDPTPAPINIVSLSQSNADNGAAYSAVAGSILTVVLETPLHAGAFLSDWCHVSGLVDNRLCYPNLAIKYISYDRKTLTFNFSDENALPSLAVPVITPTLGTAKLHFYNNMSGARNGATFRFTGTSATGAALVTLAGPNDVQVSGTLVGSHTTTIGSTNPSISSAGFGQAEVKAPTRFRIECTPYSTVFYDKSSDNANAAYSQRGARTSVKPAIQASLRPRIRAYRPKSMTRPVAKIVSISKSGSTTATVNTAAPHGLVTGNYVTIKGVRDTTNFASFATPVQVTVTSATQFTLVMGTAVTATSYSGAVILTNGGVDQQGVLGQMVQNAVWDNTAQTLTLTGSGTWSGVSITDIVELYGVRDNVSGADLGIDGAWEVYHLSTTALVLSPVTDVNGARVSPPLTTLSSTACGGAVIARVLLRAHDLQMETWTESRVVIDGTGTDRVDKSIPVRLVAPASMQGTASIDSSFPNPVGTGVRATNVNPAAMSAAGDIAASLATMIGAQIMRPYSIPESDWTYTASITVTTDTAVQAAAGAGIKRYMTAMQVQNTGAAASTFTVKDGTTARWTATLPAGMTQPLLVVFPTPLQTSANAILNVACGTATTMVVNAQGYTAP